ncbi:MAG: hypothetical protein GY842_14640, partial [bacterium]|nr:hypothetical protein [bacterium]
GVPPATDGAYVVKLDFAGEDGKVEFRHDWSSSTYDLSDQDELLADVYIETPSAIPGVMGVWSPNWNPPNTWQPASDLPTTTGVWTTVSIDVSERSQIGLDSVAAFILQGMPGADGTAYVDNLRFRSGEPSPGVDGVAAVGLADHNEIFWKPVEVEGLEGYYVYRAEAELGPFTRLNATPHSGRSYRDELAVGSPRYFYYLT